MTVSVLRLFSEKKTKTLWDMPAPALDPNTHIIIRLRSRKKKYYRYIERKSALAGTKVSVRRL